MVDHAEPRLIMHDSIKTISKQQTKSKITGPIELTAEKTNASKLKPPELSIIVPNQHKISIDINKNTILSNYSNFCITKGINAQVSTILKGKKVPSSTTTYPLHYPLISECKMRPSNNLYYRVGDLYFDNVVIFIIKFNEAYLTKDDLTSLRCLNKLHCEMFDGVMRL